MVEFSTGDVVRHELVSRIVRAFDEARAQEQEESLHREAESK